MTEPKGTCKHGELEEQIQRVVKARERKAQLDQLKKDRQSQWELDNSDLLFELGEASGRLIDVEERLRELTLQAYAETGNKAPAVGVGIRERTVLTYDNKVAFDWAKAHKMALKLDISAFEKIAKADPPDFVKITTEPQAIIATELVEVE